MEPFDYHKLLDEATYQFSRSGGKGGQNVNKVETRVELFFNIAESQLLSQEIKNKLVEQLKNKLDSHNILRITSSTQRTQHANKLQAQEKFIKLLAQALKHKKKRKPTKPSKKAKQARLESKQKQSQKKSLRRAIL